MWEVLVFLTRFVLLAAPLHFLLWLNFDATLIQELTASATALFLRILGHVASSNSIDVLITHGAQTYTGTVVRDCVGWKSVMALLGLTFAVRRVPNNQRFHGFLVGTALILTFNIIRLSSTFLAGVIWGPETFELVHTVLWRAGMTLFVFGVWALWLNMTKKAHGTML